MSDPTIRAALEAAVDASFAHDGCDFPIPLVMRNLRRHRVALELAAFLRALPHGPFIALSPDHIAGISKMVTETLAAAVERAAREGARDD